MCVFCKIVAGELPAHKIKETDKVLAFLDIKPVHPGHVLVIPKQHASTLEELSTDDLKEVVVVVQEIGRMIKGKLGYEGYNVMLNNDLVAGQEVPHLHFHIIPRTGDDQLKHWSGKGYDEGGATLIQNRLLN